jgi:GT2 family glycosyltransferase
VLDRWSETMQERLLVVHLDQNEGFGPGHNRGAEAASGDVLAFISNDVTVVGDYAGILQAEVKDGDLYGAELLRHDTGWNTFENQVIPYLAGWCIVATRSTWEELGGWDERYVPCDYEDLDLSYRAMKAKMRLVDLQLPLRHAFGQTAQALEGGRLAITQRNRELFMKKWGFSEH